MNYEGIPNPPAEAANTLDIVVRLIEHPDGTIEHQVFYPEPIGELMKFGVYSALLRGERFFLMACVNLCAQLRDTLVHHTFESLELKLALLRREQQVPYLNDAPEPGTRSIN